MFQNVNVSTKTDILEFIPNDCKHSILFPARYGLLPQAYDFSFYFSSVNLLLSEWTSWDNFFFSELIAE